jgi:hypothetical protein
MQINEVDEHITSRQETKDVFGLRIWWNGTGWFHTQQPSLCSVE